MKTRLSREQGWKDKDGVAWYSQGYLRTRTIVTRHETLEEVHAVLADFYDEEFQRNAINAKRNVSRIICKLKKRLEVLEK